jgi:hypothetical protein
MIFAEIAALVIGIMAVKRGEFSFTKNKVVCGTPARIFGALLILVLPVALALGLIAGVVLASRPGFDPARPPMWLLGLDIAVFGVLFTAAMIVGLTNAGPRQPPTARWQDDETEEDQDFDDRRERYRRRPEDDYPR